MKAVIYIQEISALLIWIEFINFERYLVIKKYRKWNKGQHNQIDIAYDAVFRMLFCIFVAKWNMVLDRIKTVLTERIFLQNSAKFCLTA